MARRKAADDLTPAIRGYAKSGWCITLDHKDCKQHFIYSDCSCECHNPVPPKKRGRPKKVVEKTVV